MPDETTLDATTEETAAVETEVQETEQKQPSKVEALARSLGWRPKEEFDGDESRWTDADEFVTVRFGKVSNQFNTTNAKVKDLERTLKSLTDHLGKVEKLAYERAVATLKKEKREAVEAGDVDRVDAIDTEIDQIHADLQEKKQEQAQPELSETVKEWLGKNKWFNSDPDMTDDASSISATYRARHPEASDEEMLAHVDTKIRKLYPEKFTNPKRQETPTVETGGNTAGGGTRKYTRSDLNDEQKRMHDYFIKTGDLTSEQYIQQLIEIGELGRKK